VPNPDVDVDGGFCLLRFDFLPANADEVEAGSSNKSSFAMRRVVLSRLMAWECGCVGVLNLLMCDYCNVLVAEEVFQTCLLM
jgi:hypothetical protein